VKSVFSIFLFFITTVIHASSWDRQWISSPISGDSITVWFKHIYVPEKLITEAHIDYATTGQCRLYVNGWRIGSPIVAVPDEASNISIAERECDISRFFRKDSVSIAFWYAPSTRNHFEGQLSAIVYGTYEDGMPFAFNIDSTWLCRPANVMIKQDSIEIINGTEHSSSWNRCDSPIMDWQQVACKVSASKTYIVQEKPLDNGLYIKKIYFPISQKTINGRIIYDFGHEIHGFIRLTLRGMHSGDTITCNNMIYICNGTTDEQAFTRFVPETSRYAVIQGPQGFSAIKIMKIEYLEIPQSDF
jgi:hypothetical protein